MWTKARLDWGPKKSIRATAQKTSEVKSLGAGSRTDILRKGWEEGQGKKRHAEFVKHLLSGRRVKIYSGGRGRGGKE